jgi:catechol 2,3-dioxygenase-like lactoylglutathione lyase family enzyme
VKVKRIGFVGTRTQHVDEMTAFFRDVLGLEERYTQGDWTISQLPSGSFDLAEVYGSDLRDERLLPNDVNAPMITFVVDDVVAARAEVAAAGIEILGDTVWAAEAFEQPGYEGIAWFFVRAPDGHVYGIQQARD